MEATMTLPADALPKKKIKTGTIVAIGGGAVALIGGYFVFFYKDKDDRTLWQKWTDKGGDKPIEKVEEPKEAPPAGVKWVAESANPFPLKKGSWGGYTKNLQKALGIGDDGKFGSGTEKAVKAKWNKVTVDKADYDALVNPKAPEATEETGGANYDSLIKSLGWEKGDVTGENSKYRFHFAKKGTWVLTELGKTAELKNGTYKTGGRVMSVTGGKDYKLGDVFRNMKSIVKEFYGFDGDSKPSFNGKGNNFA